MEGTSASSLAIEDSFRPRLSPRWQRLQAGGGHLVVTGDGLRMLVSGARRDRYADAQIDDYAGLPRRHFPWRPPLRLTVRARASGPLAGTAGFGFWNNCFSPLVERPALPAAIWFFHASRPSDLPLAMDVPGHGWKAACIDATRPAALAWAPLAPLVVPLNHVPPFYRRVWPAVQRSLAIAEAPIPAIGPAWRTYTLEWHERGARFAVDGAVALETDRAPGGPLGFVAWIDNQWAAATPWGRFGWGLLAVAGTQWMDLGFVRVEA